MNPSTKSTRHIETNVNTCKENQDHQNNNNEVENLMLKGHTLPQIISDRCSLAGMCGRWKMVCVEEMKNLRREGTRLGTVE
jgi:hypothetical protein